MSIVELDRAPNMSRLYAAAGAGALRSRLRRGPGHGGTLPDVVHRLRSVTADPATLTAFQHLVGESARDRLPAGYVHALAFPVAMSVMTREDFPLPLLGMVHLKNRIRQHRPVALTESLDFDAWAEGLRGHRRGTAVDVIAEARVGPEVVWRGVSTYLAKGVFLADSVDSTTHGAPAPDQGSAPEHGGVPAQGETFTRPTFDPPTPTALWRLGADTGRAYAAVSGDYNPIHLSSVSAKLLGMRGSIAHGMYLASRALAESGTAGLDAFDWDVDFGAPVFLPARVSMRIQPAQGAESGPGGSGPGGSGQGGSGQGGSNPGPGAREYTGWNRRSGRRHFGGSVRPLR